MPRRRLASQSQTNRWRQRYPITGAKQEKPSSECRLTDQCARWAPAEAGWFSGVASSPTPALALDSSCTWAARSPWEQVRYTPHPRHGCSTSSPAPCDLPLGPGVSVGVGRTLASVGRQCSVGLCWG